MNQSIVTENPLDLLYPQNPDPLSSPKSWWDIVHAQQLIAKSELDINSPETLDRTENGTINLSDKLVGSDTIFE